MMGGLSMYPLLFKKKIFIIVLLLNVLIICSSCESQKNAIESKNVNSVKLNYITTECKEVQARTKISVIDGTVYCMWVDVAYNDEGRENETYVLDVFENGSWKNISRQENEFEGSPYFEKTYVYPLCEKIGDKIIYTDSNNDLYIFDTLNKGIYDLKINLEDWRAFATDNKNVFAVLSSATNDKGGAEIRIYDISKI